LNDITKAYAKNHELESLLFDDFFNKAIHNAQPGWRRVIAQAVLWGIPTPAFSTALAFFDGYRSEIVSANILQAQVYPVRCCLRYCANTMISVITLARTPSAFSPAKRTRPSWLTRIFVRFNGHV
jgi:hypothetical protein